MYRWIFLCAFASVFSLFETIFVLNLYMWIAKFDQREWKAGGVTTVGTALGIGCQAILVHLSGISMWTGVSEIMGVNSRYQFYNSFSQYISQMLLTCIDLLNGTAIPLLAIIVLLLIGGSKKFLWPLIASFIAAIGLAVFSPYHAYYHPHLHIHFFTFFLLIVLLRFFDRTTFSNWKSLLLIGVMSMTIITSFMEMARHVHSLFTNYMQRDDGRLITDIILEYDFSNKQESEMIFRDSIWKKHHQRFSLIDGWFPPQDKGLEIGNDGVRGVVFSWIKDIPSQRVDLLIDKVQSEIITDQCQIDHFDQGKWNTLRWLPEKIDWKNDPKYQWISVMTDKPFKLLRISCLLSHSYRFYELKTEKNSTPY